LNVFATLEGRGADLNDDGVVGQEIARAGVYTFRDKSLSLDEALNIEARKPKRSQRTRTFARDLRRFFLLLGFLANIPDGSVAVTALGDHLLGLGSQSVV
jgi:hypothetical protein